MSNIIKMHLFRVKRAKSTKVLAILAGLFFLFTFALAFFIYENPLDIDPEILSIFLGENFNGTRPYMLHEFYFQNDSFIILVTIFTVLLATSDISKGYVKNIYGMFEDKSKFVFAKWGAMVICVSIAYAVYSFVSLGLSLALMRSMKATDWVKYINSFLVLYLCLISLLTLVYMITSLFKSAVGGMVVGMVMASGMCQSIEQLLDLLIAKLSGANLEDIAKEAIGVGKSNVFKISDYCIDNVFLTYSAKLGTADTIRTVIVALVYMGLALAVCTSMAKKKDVRC